MAKDPDILNLPALVASMTPEQLSSKAGKTLTNRLVRSSFEAWCRYRLNKIKREPALHHLFIIRTLEKLIKGELGKQKVIILTPPGAAKSTYTSKLFPAWFVNKDQFPSDSILACSYAHVLARDFCSYARDLVEEDHEILGVTPNKNKWAADNWELTTGGGEHCAGVGSGVAGRRAKLGLIDDYIGSQEEADSQTIRDKQWSWYWNDFFPRLIPNESWEFIIANRRHEDDLVGRILNSRNASSWLVIKLPFFAEENDPLGRPCAPLSLLEGEDLTEESRQELEAKIVKTRLWPDWFSEERALEVLHLPDARVKAGLWQQNPRPLEGNYFKAKWLVGYKPEELPKDLRFYAGSDWALRKEDINDRTCHLPCGVDSTGVIWILPDWFWDRCDTLEATQAMFAIQQRRKTICWWHGKENITGSIGPFVYREMREKRIYVPITELSETRNKEQKAQAIKAFMMMKMVRFPKWVPGWDEAENELLTFPGGLHDDFVDALSKIGQGLDLMVPASKKKVEWDGVLRPEPLTCGWLERSHKRRMRDRDLALRD